jgi:4-amino-4-deoxy-L-arabinose transferase-like glycosyltransferase
LPCVNRQESLDWPRDANENYVTVLLKRFGDQLTFLKQHRVFLLLIAFAAVVFLSDIWIYKEFVRAESYFALGSRLMVEQGDWLIPHAPDERPLNKPPLTYWLIGIAYKLFGANYGSARLPSVLAGLFVLLIVYWLAVKQAGVRAGLISVAVLASSYLFPSFARMAMSDMLLTLWITASLACFSLVLKTPEPGSRKLALLGYVFLALGVLTKGPVALALIGMPVGLELLLSRKRKTLKRLRLFPGLILFVLIVAPYFFFVYARLGPEPLRFFFFGENLQRFTGQIYGAASRPFWYELAAFFSDFAPWSLLIPVAVWFDWRARRLFESRARATRLLYLWLGWTVLLFSLSSFKLDYYLLPAMPAAALIIAPVIANAGKQARFVRGMIGAFLLLCSVVIIAVAILSFKAGVLLLVQSPVRFLPGATAAVGVGVIVFYLARRQTCQAALILAATMWATILTVQLALLPALVHYLPSAQLAAGVPAGSTLYTSSAASDWANCLAFELPPPHRVERFTGELNNEKLLAALKSDTKSVAIIREREYESLAAQEPALKILASAETFGHGGLSLKIIRDPRRESLFMVGALQNRER